MTGISLCLRIAVVACALSVGLAAVGPANATMVQVAQLVDSGPPTPQANDELGTAVALSADGTIALAGQPYAVSYRGAVVVFAQSHGSWTRQARLGQGGVGDRFGQSVALSADGTTAIVGAPNDDVPTTTGGDRVDQGSAVVFTRSGSTWVRQQLLVESAGWGGDFFGVSVALSADGNTAIVGAYRDDVDARLDQGSAVVFTRSGDLWTQQGRLVDPAGALADYFGAAVALSGDGNTAVVGAYMDDISGRVNQGSATVFTRSAGTWTRQQKLVDAAGAVRDYLAFSVALSADGTTVILGALADDVGAHLDQGSAVVFVHSGASWTLQAQLTDSAGSANAEFGRSVAVSSHGNVAIVGGYSHSGTAVLFARSAATWRQTQTLICPPGGPNDHFGSSVGLSVDGHTAIVGAPLLDLPTASARISGADRGSVVVFVAHR